MLFADLQSSRRDYIRVAAYYLYSHGAPRPFRAETREQWHELSKELIGWMHTQDHAVVSQLTAGYPEFKKVQSPYYPD